MDCEVVIETEVEDNYEHLVKNNAPNRKIVRKRSDMWNYFTPIDENVASCNMCGLDFSYRTSTTNLRKHVLCKHFGGYMENAPKVAPALAPKNTTQAEDNSSSNVLAKKCSREENSIDRIVNSSRELHNYTKRTRTESLKQDNLEVLHDSSPLSKHNSWTGDERRNSDMYDAYAFTIAAKLRKLEERQRLYAERIINEALFKGAIGQLSPISEIVICLGSNSDSLPS